MNERIRQAIIWAISNEYDLPVYIDTIEQDLEEPCFLINTLLTTETHIVMNRYERQYPYMIQYFPKDGVVYHTECSAVSDRLMDILEYVRYKETIYRASSLSGEVVNGMLNFSATYKPMVIKQYRFADNQDVFMEKLEQNHKVKE